MPLTRFVFSPASERLPLEIDTIGLNPDQEAFDRPDGYTCHHWLQTLEGEGEISVGDAIYRLPPRSGILLAPGVPHAYRARGAAWKTAYVTFSGLMADSFVQALLGGVPGKIHWDEEEDAIGNQLERLLRLAEAGEDLAGWDKSAELYRFLTLLKTNGRKNALPSLSRRMERLRDLLEWLEREYANPELGLARMAERLNVGERQLNERFRESFGLTAYAYLIRLRLRKAKEWLPSRPDMTVRAIGEAVGFRDASHFIATFRHKEGMTPEAYRRLHGSSQT